MSATPPLLALLRVGDSIEALSSIWWAYDWFPVTYQGYDPIIKVFYAASSRQMITRDFASYPPRQFRLIPNHPNNATILARVPDPKILQVLETIPLPPCLYRKLSRLEAWTCYNAMPTLAYQKEGEVGVLSRKSQRKKRNRLREAIYTQGFTSDILVLAGDYQLFLTQWKQSQTSVIFHGLSDPKSSMGRAVGNILWDRNIVRIWLALILIPEPTPLSPPIFTIWRPQVARSSWFNFGA